MPSRRKRGAFKRHSHNHTRPHPKTIAGIHLPQASQMTGNLHSEVAKDPDVEKENLSESNITADVCGIDSEESDSDILSDIATNHSDSCDLEDSFWDNEDEVPDSWCSQDLDMIDLAAKFAIMARENKVIKKELCSLRNNLTENLSLLKEIPSLMSSVTQLISEVKEARTEATILKDELGKARQTIQAMSASNSLVSENQITCQQDVILVEDCSDDETLSCPEDITCPEDSITFPEDIACPEDTNNKDTHPNLTRPFMQFSGESTDFSQQHFENNSMEVHSTVMIDHLYCGGSATADYVDFGGKRVPRDKLDEISHRKVSILAAELCVLLYTPREMALCSLSGKKSNAHRTSFPKKPLDPNRLEAIIDYVGKVTGMERKLAQQEVLKAIKVKLGNFLKTDEAKRIIMGHFESLGIPNPYQLPVTISSMHTASLYASANQSQQPEPVTQNSADTTVNFAVVNQQPLPVSQDLEFTIGNFVT